MFDSIASSLSNLTGHFAGNLLDRVLDLAPGLVTNLLSTAANTVLPGSGVLAQAIGGPIVGAGFDAVETLARDALLPAASGALGQAGDLCEFGNFAASLAGTFLGGVQQGWNG